LLLGEVEDVIRDGAEEPVVDTGVGYCPCLVIKASLQRAIDAQAKAKLATQGEEEG
jgi:hypothetical protein